MKTFRGSRETAHLDPGRTRSSRSALVLAFLALLLPLVVGCSTLDESTVSSQADALGALVTTSTESTATTPETVAAASQTVAAAETTTSTFSKSTTTTEPDSTTTTAPKSTTTTTVPESTTTTESLEATATTAVAAAETDETVLYEITDWSSGTSGWAAAGQWKTAGGMLVTDGSSDSFAVAPVDLTDYPDYAVECEVQFLDPEVETDVFLMARMINGLGYWAGFDGSDTRMVIGYGEEDLGDAHFVLDGNWHQYRLEVRGNSIKLFFEEAEVARTMDNRALDPGTVGIYCGNGQINVRAFRVIAL